MIGDFANNGLDSGLALSSSFGARGSPSAVFGLTPDTFAAFGGVNPNVGVGEFNEPLGRSVYGGLQMSYKQHIGARVPGLASMDLIASYTLSKFAGTGGSDQNFSPLAFDFRNPTAFSGPTLLDRRNQIKFGFDAQVVKWGPRFSVIGNFGSPVPTTLTLLSAGGTTQAGGIFETDLTGDGTVGDLFPVSNGKTVGQPGQYDRSVGAAGLQNAINSWNNTQANSATPAGLALIDAGLFSLTQLQEIQAVKPFVAPEQAGQLNNPWYKEVSMVLAWPIKIREGISLEPSFSAYNVFNNSNFARQTGILTDGFGAIPDPLDNPAGSVQNTNLTGAKTVGSSRESLRIGTGSGVFAQGAPRQLEFGLKLNF
jgi:hypothetical protein